MPLRASLSPVPDRPGPVRQLQFECLLLLGAHYIKYSASIIDSSYDIYSEWLAAKQIKQLNQNAEQYLRAVDALRARVRLTVSQTERVQGREPQRRALRRELVGRKFGGRPSDSLVATQTRFAPVEAKGKQGSSAIWRRRKSFFEAVHRLRGLLKRKGWCRVMRRSRYAG